MKCVKGYSEQEIIDIITKIVNVLAQSFRFGSFQTEDLKQNGFIYGIEALDRYDGKRPLDNFLYIHIRNQYINLKRNKYRRAEIPCKTCIFYRPNQKNPTGNDCAVFENKTDCEKFDNFLKRNKAKSSLSGPSNSTEAVENLHDAVGDDVESRELMEKIDRLLPVEFRADYLRLLNGVSINKARKMRVQAEVEKILGGTPSEPPEGEEEDG